MKTKDKVKSKLKPLINQSSVTDESVERLINNATPSKSIVQRAIEQEKAEEDEKQIRKVRAMLGNIDEVTQRYVERLRAVRKLEKEFKGYVKDMMQIKQDFMNDGDIDKIESRYMELANKSHRNAFRID